LATPNYAFAKRQRDLAKKAKKEEKLKRKSEGATDSGPVGEPATPAADTPPVVDKETP
jgi:hypothetical protein